MGFENRSKNDLVDILSAGASISMNVGVRQSDEWIDLAFAAKNGGGHLTIKGVSQWTKERLVNISFAGRGHVTFTD